MKGMAGLHGEPVRQLNPSSCTAASLIQVLLNTETTSCEEVKLSRTGTIQRNVICPMWVESDNSVHLIPATQLIPQEAEFPWFSVRHLQKTRTKRQGGNALEHQLGVITSPSSCKFQWQLCSAKLSSSSLAEPCEVAKPCLQVAVLTPRCCFYGFLIIFLNKEGLAKQLSCTAAASCPLLTSRGWNVLSNSPPSTDGCSRRQLHIRSSCSQEAPEEWKAGEPGQEVFVQLHPPARWIHKVSFMAPQRGVH